MLVLLLTEDRREYVVNRTLLVLIQRKVSTFPRDEGSELSRPECFLISTDPREVMRGHGESRVVRELGISNTRPSDVPRERPVIIRVRVRITHRDGVNGFRLKQSYREGFGTSDVVHFFLKKEKNGVPRSLILKKKSHTPLLLFFFLTHRAYVLLTIPFLRYLSLFALCRTPT